MGLIDNHDAARRLARAIASDIALYNEAKIIAGLQRDNLFTLLDREIEEGRALYRSRITAELDAATNYYDLAIVDVLIKPKGNVRSAIW